MALLTEFIPRHAASHLRHDSLCEKLVTTISARNMGNDTRFSPVVPSAERTKPF